MARPIANSGPGAPRNPTSPRFDQLPQVSLVTKELRRRGVTSLGEVALTQLVREELQRVRVRIAEGSALDRAGILDHVAAVARKLEHARLSPVINATGVLVHTNLGRAPVSEETARAMGDAAMSPVPLEIDPETNDRGGRMSEISHLMALLTGAQATLVVNNNAAAVLLTLSALAAGRSVLVSRGEAVEIGGGFRIPDVIAQSGARLVDVGTTNRTYAGDYERAIDPSTAALLKVHTSNFALRGFVHAASIADLASLARDHCLPLIEDLGSGAIIDPSRFGIADEATIGAALSAGASLVLASGDKLLGGPQAGIIAGERELVELVAAHPLARAVRADKTCLAGLAATLRHYARNEGTEKIPVWRMIAASVDDLRIRGDRIVAEAGDSRLGLRETTSTIGGGAAPEQGLPSWAIGVDNEGRGAIDDIARRCRLSTPGLYGRIEEGTLLFDLRSVLPEQDAVLTSVLRDALPRA